MIWNGEQLQDVLKVKVNPQLQSEIIQFNSKDVKEGDLFIALPGASDSHKYIKDALHHGASLVIADKKIEDIPQEKIILVPDTSLALGQLAKYKRDNSKAKFIAVTGSVGKTSTKEALKIMFEAFGKTFASRGNFNNDIGVPINLASMPENLDYAIFELGMSSAGEIRKLSKLVEPDIAIITNVAAAHLEFFNSIEDIADAKCEIFEGLSSQGTAIICRDSTHYDQMIKNITKHQVENIYSFGKSKCSNSRLIMYDNFSNSTHLVYKINDTQIEMNIPYILPTHLAENFASCLQVAGSIDLDLAKAAKALELFSLGEGRGKTINVSKAEKKFQVISDYYNANPASVKASLQYVKQLKHSKKLLIIGDMLELGTTSQKLHEELVPFIVESGATKILLVGTKVKFINDLLSKKLYTRQFDNVNLLMLELDHILEDKELILIKGSRGIGLQKIMQYFDKE